MFKFKKRPGGLAGMVKDAPSEPLFSTIEDDGTETVYTVPTEVPVAIALAYTNIVAKHGQELATAWALDLLLTSDGLTSLVETGPSLADLTRVTTVVLARIRGVRVLLNEIVEEPAEQLDEETPVELLDDPKDDEAS